MLVGVLAREGDGLKACAGGSSEKRRMGGRLVLLDAGKKMGEACVGGEKMCGGGEPARAVSLTGSDERNSSGEERAVLEAAERHIWK